MQNPWEVIVRPAMSEKVDKLKKAQNVYTFVVSRSATKPEIKNAVEKVYNVKVESVNTLVVKGKFKKQKNMVMTSRRADVKKAYIKLKSGSRIDSL